MFSLFKRKNNTPNAHSSPPRFGGQSDFLRFNDLDAIRWNEMLSGGCLVLGQPGAGKSSGVIASVVSAWVRGGGNVVFTSTKPAEAQGWAGLSSRLGCVVDRFTLSSTFNALQHELATGVELGQLNRLLAIAMTPLRRRQQQSTSSDGGFFEAQAERYVYHLLVLLALGARNSLSFRTLNQSLLSLPASPRDVQKSSWQASCPAYAALVEADRRQLSPLDRQSLADAAHLLLKESPSTPSRTRASVVSTMCSALFSMTTGEVGACVNAEVSSWTPQWVTEGSRRALVLDCPIQTFGPVAATTQRLCLSAIQQSILLRTISPQSAPVLIVMDEGHNFIDPDVDIAFGTSARDRGGAILLGTQTCGQIRTACGSARDPQAAAAAVLGMSTVKIFAATSDVESTKYAQDSFADTLQSRVSISNADHAGDRSGSVRGGGASSSLSREYAPDVRASQIAALRRGGPMNKFRVDAFVSVGRLWPSNGRPSLLVTFPQYRLGDAR